MNKFVKLIEFERLKKKNLNTNLSFLNKPLIYVGNFIIVWYLTRDNEKSSVIFQYFKGLCISFKNKGLNSKFILRNVLDKTVIEKDLFFWNINNIYIYIYKKNMKHYRSNKLFFLRKQKRKKSKFFIN